MSPPQAKPGRAPQEQHGAGRQRGRGCKRGCPGHANPTKPTITHASSKREGQAPPSPATFHRLHSSPRHHSKIPLFFLLPRASASSKPRAVASELPGRVWEGTVRGSGAATAALPGDRGSPSPPASPSPTQPPEEARRAQEVWSSAAAGGLRAQPCPPRPRDVQGALGKGRTTQERSEPVVYEKTSARFSSLSNPEARPEEAGTAADGQGTRHQHHRGQQ